MGNYCAGNIARRSAVPKLGGGAATAIALAGFRDGYIHQGLNSTETGLSDVTSVRHENVLNFVFSKDLCTRKAYCYGRFLSGNSTSGPIFTKVNKTPTSVASDTSQSHRPAGASATTAFSYSPKKSQLRL